MHIGFLTDGYLPQLNGVATSIDSLTRALEDLGHRVTIVAPAMDGYSDRRPGVYRYPSVKVTRDPPLWLAVPFSRTINAELKRLDLDLIHTHAPFTMHLAAYRVARQLRVPLVTTYHTLLPAYRDTVKLLGVVRAPKKLTELYSVWTCDICDQIISPSEKIEQFLHGLGVRPPIAVIPNGIDVPRFQEAPRGWLRARLHLSGDDSIVLCVGRLTPEKNVGFLVEMMAELVKHNPNAYLVAVGSGPLRVRFEAQARELGIERHVLFTGPVPIEQMPQVFADAEVYVTASFSEVHSVAALEALAAGLPLVTVNDPSFMEAVEDGENGYWVEADTGLFAARVAEILNHPELRARFSAHSRERAQNFSVEKQARETAAVYAETVRRYAARRAVVH